jgi:hypothetical protein
VWQAASSSEVRFIVGEGISTVVFLWDCGFVMADLRKQRVCVKFCFKLGQTAAETHQMLKQAFGDNSLGQTKTYECYKRFTNRRKSTDDDDRSAWPSIGFTSENDTAENIQAERQTVLYTLTRKHFHDVFQKGQKL